ncbi:MAG: pyridoxamine kinase [archaeon]|nr:pyridoxamine kinase [archaeon]
MSQKRVLAIHDISCFGRCSLTVALPIISSTGVECTVIPTAVLSTHTGGFTDFTYRDLTDDIVPIVNHWKTLGIRFDAIYTGFLGSFQQIAIVADIFDKLKKNTVVVVDPVMADNGKLYTIFPSEFPIEMRKLCSKADVLIPNITEATLLLNEEYIDGPYSLEYIDGLMKKLTILGPKKIVLTGVFFDDKKIGVATYDAETCEKSYYFSDRIPGYYHGTGDVFSSAVVAALVNRINLSDASRIAVDFTVGSIKRTYNVKTDTRFGVDFEEGIEQFIRDVVSDSKF